LQQELREKGLSEAAIARAFETAELDWWALAEAAFRKKFGEPARVDPRERGRRSRFMQYRGFAADHYQHLLDL
jgi:regulatory protein